MSRREHSRALFLMAATVCAATAVACSGQQNAMTSPTTTSAPQSAAVPASSAALTGATIAGTVVGVSTASSLRTLGVAMTVTVTGSSASATVDGSGHFTLTNVPTGHVQLHFVGSGTDALLELDGVAEHATVVITVRVSGHDAHLEDDHGEVEVNGTLTSLGGSCAAHNLSFMVGTTKVVTNASTVFHAASCGSLKAGSHVELQGTRQSDGSVLATSVQGDGEDQNDNGGGNDDHGQDGQGQGNAGAEAKGTIAAGSLAGACASNSLSFKIGTTIVKTNASTKFEDTSCSSLKAGDTVEVAGTRQADASILASKVQRDN